MVIAPNPMNLESLREPDRSFQTQSQIKQQKGYKTMAYTPELSQIGSATLRRLAWHFDKPMTKSLEMLIGLTAMKMPEMKPGEVCKRCREDSICETCPFHTPSTFYRNL